MNSYIDNLSILHISDLHRNPDKRINNSVLIDSLEGEKAQYEKEGIPSPNVIVITGDIVMGINGNSESDLIELASQYDEAYEFLIELSNIFLNGNRSRVIIVPGNHDVNRFHSKNSMQKIDTTDPKVKSEVKRKYFNGDTSIRWCWDTFEFYKIENNEVYSNRFELFSRFYNKFYSSDKAYSLLDDQQYEIFDFIYETDIIILKAC